MATQTIAGTGTGHHTAGLRQAGPRGSTAGAARKEWTEAELQALPHDGHSYELVDGELVMSPKNNVLHGDLASRLLVAIENFNRVHRLGVVLDSSTGFWMANRNCRAPDVSLVSLERMKRAGFTRRTARFFPGGPDLAIEVLAPSHTRAELDARLRDFFSSGTRLAWVVHPEEQYVEVCHSLTERQIIGTGAVLEGEPVLPGFRLPVSELFNFEEGD